MPRKTTEEVIADLEAKLAEAKAKAVTKVDEQKAKLTERITALKERRSKIDEQITVLEAEIDVLTKGEDADAEQPELPTDNEPVKTPARSGAKS